ncbi:cupin domain protein [Xylaria digitata]|nr:cupin domain protein [Xylaria digitata]
MVTGQIETPSSTTASDLSNPTRVITTTNPENGVSFFEGSFDKSVGVVRNLGGSLLRLAYALDQAPQVLNRSDLEIYGGFLKSVSHLASPGGGANVWYIDTPPGARSPMHRTVSLDFVIAVEGELQLTLDSGETRILKVGDIVIQRGTTHQWRNVNKDKWARMIGVMSEIQPITLNNGTKLGTSGLG